MQDDCEQSFILQDTREEKDLGIWMDSTLKFSVHAARAAIKANQILGFIQRSLVYLHIPLMKHLYISMLHPHLEFGKGIRHLQFKKNQEILKNVQHRACSSSVKVPLRRKITTDGVALNGL